jgi:hypothetical protein
MFTDVLFFDQCPYLYDLVPYEVIRETFIDDLMLTIAILDVLEKKLYYHDEQFRQYAFTAHDDIHHMERLEFRMRFDMGINK